MTLTFSRVLAGLVVVVSLIMAFGSVPIMAVAACIAMLGIAIILHPN
jgi:hypothetical protein